MSVIIGTRFESALTEANGDAYVGSHIGDRKTVMESDTGKRNWRKILGTDSGYIGTKRHIWLIFTNFLLFTVR